MIKKIKSERKRREFNAGAMHPMQSYEWGEFRETTGVRVERYGIYKGGKLVETIQVSIHPLRIGNLSIGYLPKGYMPNAEQTKALREIAKRNRCIFIKVEPKAEISELNKQREEYLSRNGYVRGRELFTKYNFVLDLDKTEDELLSGMKSKTRYNIRLAERKGVRVSVDNGNETFERYLELMQETTERQGFYAHGEGYHRKMWETMSRVGIARMIKAEYEGEIVTVWVLFFFNDSVYYPYGASSRDKRDVMANNLVMWEAIKLAKREGYKYFDMWGALGSNPDKDDPWYGFHKFKEGYGARHVEYIGTYDLINMPVLYPIFRVIERLRWMILRTIKPSKR